MLNSREHGVLVLQGPRERLPGVLVGLDEPREGVICGPPELASAAEYAEGLIAAATAARSGGAAVAELEALTRGLGWEGRLRCALGLLRDALPRRRPPLRLVCVCCPRTVADEAEQERLIEALLEHTPELPWFYGIRLVVHAPAGMRVRTRPPFVRTRALVADWSGFAAYPGEERSAPWTR